MKEEEKDNLDNNKEEKEELGEEFIETTRCLPTDVGEEIKEAYLSYAMSVIVGRALPDVRDGLKPVHRRVLYSMEKMGNTPDKPYKKSARIVGDIIGKYHPHGDIAVYDTLVRMPGFFLSLSFGRWSGKFWFDRWRLGSRSKIYRNSNVQDCPGIISRYR